MSCSCCVSVSTKLHGHSDTEVSVVTTNIMHTSTMCYKHHFDPKIFSEDVLGFIDISILFFYYTFICYIYLESQFCLFAFSAAFLVNFKHRSKLSLKKFLSLFSQDRSYIKLHHEYILNSYFTRNVLVLKLSTTVQDMSKKLEL